MSFLDRFSEAHRSLFESVATTIELQRGAHLIRRGEPGGDIFLLKTGNLEVVDSRSTPEVILAVLSPGVVVGEMAFVDDSPRSADVRAAGEAIVLQWRRDDLRALLKREVAFAASFYETIARLAAERVRTVTTTAVAGGLGGRRGSTRTGLGRVTDDARELAEGVKDALVDVETRLRTDSTDKVAQAQVYTVLDRLESAVQGLFAAHPDSESAEAASRVLARELNPYLVRSSLAERCLRRPQSVSASPDILAHVFVNSPAGDGQLGELFDRWLLDRPTLRALRALRDPIVVAVDAGLPTHRNRRLLQVNAGTGSLVASLCARLAERPTVFTVVDQSRDSLAYLDAGIAPRGITLEPVQEGFVPFALGRSRHTFPAQDAVVLYGLAEYLPDRLMVSLLHSSAKLLARGGRLVVSALSPSADATLLDRLLEWPTIRREPEHLVRLIDAAGLRAVEVQSPMSPGLIAIAQAPELAPDGHSQ